MNGQIGADGQDLLLAALSESGLAFDDFPTIDLNDQNDFDLGLLGPPDPGGSEVTVSSFHWYSFLKTKNTEVKSLK